jgi:VWFA-related protein
VSHSLDRIRRLDARAVAATFLIALLSTPAAQQPPRSTTPISNQDAVFRVTTQLVKSDVLVFDARGAFVDDLRREQFELLVDGKPQPIVFFDRIRAGSATEQAQLAAARGEPAEAPSTLLQGGRAVLFFVDDFHIAGDSLERTRRVLASYVDHELGPHDAAAIGSASGQLGFLEQATGSATMLRAAAARLKVRPRMVVDTEMPRMAPNQAQIIERGSDRDLFEFYVKETLRQNPLMKRAEAELYVAGRARAIVQQSAAVVRDTLNALERFMASKAELPGRHVVFFLSDGFLMDPADSDMTNWMRRVADMAARSNAVIYTMDARGLATQPSYDASRPGVIDDTRSVDRAEADELSTSQDPLYRIASETGGRAIANTNGLVDAIPRVLKETAAYYVLAWAPEEAPPNRRFHRVAVSVKGRPELRVRVPRGLFNNVPEARPASTRDRREPSPPIAPLSGVALVEADLLAALRSPFPVNTLPTSLALDFFDFPKLGPVIKVSAQLTGESVVDVAAAVFNDRGEGVSSLKEQVTATGHRATLTHQFQVKPGLYQVRVSARDATTGKAGSAMDWIEIPNPGSGPFSMSSLVVDRELPRLRFLTYVYNARRSGKRPPDVVLKIEVFRGRQRVVATPAFALKPAAVENPARLPYFGELNCEGMPAGSYALHVTATDRAAGVHISRRAAFEIE